VFEPGDGAIEGVFYYDGAPTPSHEIEAKPIRNERTVRGVTHHGGKECTTATDKDGRFRFAALPEHSYLVTVTVHKNNDEGLEVDYGHCWDQVAVRSGETTHVDLHYGAIGTGRIYGTVKENGEPAAAEVVDLEILRLNGNHVYRTEKRARADVEGNYEFTGLPEGVYTVALQSGRDKARRNVHLTDGAAVRVDIPFDVPAGAVAGVVRAEGLFYEQMGVKLRPLDNAVRVFRLTRPDATGRFVFESVPAGRYYLRTGIRGQRVTYEIDVLANRTTNQDIRLSSGSGSLEVTLLKDGLAPENLDASVALERSIEVFCWPSVAEEAGVFFFDSLAPGTYRVVAKADGLLQQTYAEVSPGEMTSLELSFEGTATLRGFVDTGNIWLTEVWVREPGHPLPVVDGELGGRSGISGAGIDAPDGTIAFTEGGGTYEIGGLSVGRYEVVATGRIHDSVPLKTRIVAYDVYLEDGQTTELDITMTE